MSSSVHNSSNAVARNTSSRSRSKREIDAEEAEAQTSAALEAVMSSTNSFPQLTPTISTSLQTNATATAPGKEVRQLQIQPQQQQQNAAHTSTPLLLPSAMPFAVVSTERQRFELALLKLRGRLQHRRRRAEDVFCLVLSASALTRSIIAAQMRNLMWKNVDDSSTVEGTEELIEKRLTFLMKRHSDPLVRQRVLEERKALVQQQQQQQQQQNIIGGETKKEESGETDNNKDKNNGERLLGSSSPSRTTRPLPADEFIQLVIVDAYLHGDYVDTVATLRRLEKDFGGTIITVLLPEPRQGKSLGVEDGLGMQLLPESIVTAHEGYAAGFDLVIPNKAFDHTVGLFLSEVFLSAVGRWQEKWETTASEASGAAKVLRQKGVGIVDDDDDENNDDGDNDSDTRVYDHKKNDSSPPSSSSATAKVAHHVQKSGGAGGAKGPTSVVANYNTIRHLLLSEHDQSGGEGGGVLGLHGTNAMEKRAKGHQSQVNNNNGRTPAAIDASCIDTNPDFIKLLSRYEFALISVKKLQEKVKMMAESQEFVAKTNVALEAEVATLKKKLAQQQRALRRRRGLGGRNAKEDEMEVGDLELETDAEAQTLEEILDALGLNTPEEVVRELQAAKQNRIADAGQINTLSQQVSKLRQKIAEATRELAELENAKREQSAQIKELSDELEDIKDGKDGIVGKRAQLETLVETQRQDLELLGQFLLDLKEIYGSILPERFHRRFGRLLEEEVGDVLFNHYRRELQRDYSSLDEGSTNNNNNNNTNERAVTTVMIKSDALVSLSSALISPASNQQQLQSTSFSSPVVVAHDRVSTETAPLIIASASSNSGAFPVVAGLLSSSPTFSSSSPCTKHQNNKFDPAGGGKKDPLSGMLLEDIDNLLSGIRQREIAAEADYFVGGGGSSNKSPARARVGNSISGKAAATTAASVPLTAAGGLFYSSSPMTAASTNDNQRGGAGKERDSNTYITRATTRSAAGLPSTNSTCNISTNTAHSVGVNSSSHSPTTSTATATDRGKLLFSPSATPTTASVAIPTQATPSTLSPNFLKQMTQLRKRRLSQATLMRQLMQDKEISLLHRLLRRALHALEANERTIMENNDINQDFSTSTGASRRGTRGLSIFGGGGGGAHWKPSASMTESQIAEHVGTLVAQMRPGFVPVDSLALYSRGTKADKATMTGSDDGKNHHELTDSELVALWHFIRDRRAAGRGGEEGRDADLLESSATLKSAHGNNLDSPKSVITAVAAISTSGGKNENRNAMEGGSAAADDDEDENNPLIVIKKFLEAFRNRGETETGELEEGGEAAQLAPRAPPHGNSSTTFGVRRRYLLPSEAHDKTRFAPSGPYSGLTPHALPAAVAGPHFKLRK